MPHILHQGVAMACTLEEFTQIARKYFPGISIVERINCFHKRERAFTLHEFSEEYNKPGQRYMVHVYMCYGTYVDCTYYMNTYRGPSPHSSSAGDTKEQFERHMASIATTKESEYKVANSWIGRLPRYGQTFIPYEEWVKNIPTEMGQYTVVPSDADTQTNNPSKPE